MSSMAHMDKKEEDLLELIGTLIQLFKYLFHSLVLEHSVPLDIDKINRERIEQDCNLWDALESSKWLPCEALEIN